MDEKIDFIISWVDGNDSNWLNERNHYAQMEHMEIDNGAIRYRDWELLRYWFRGVEKFAPWVNKIYFITCGHLPEWLNISHPKLKIIKHSDYIPQEYLPTFNSNVIEYYLHNIPGLSEQFVYFNDDMFLTDNVLPPIFFKKGLPCDVGGMKSTNNRGIFGTNVYLARMLINDYFKKRDVIKKNLNKWFNYRYLFFSFRNIFYYFISGKEFVGFIDHHLPQPYLKRTFTNVWRNCEKDLIRSSKSRFREYGGVAFWLMRYWQLASGDFFPCNPYKSGAYFELGKDNICMIEECIRLQKKQLICLNDSGFVEDYYKIQKIIAKAFDSILPDRCSFEIK